MMSVDEDENWVPVVTLSIDRCYDQFSATGEFDCGTEIPRHLYLIINCAYTENYLKFAKWNPFGIKECTYTMQYVKMCFDEEVPNDYEDMTS